MATTAALVTGAEWSYDREKGRWVADFDPHAVRDIPIAWADFFADLESSYASHVILAAAPLVCPGSSEQDGTIKARMMTDGTGTLRRLYPFTVRVTTADGQSDDQTLWLRLVER